LRPGVVSFTNEFEAEQKLFISSGFVEVQPHIVMVLADTVTHTKKLDDAATLAAMERAQKAIVAKPQRRIGTNS
jgi:F-type H+-transporting ATPase subunit epsilon